MEINNYKCHKSTLLPNLGNFHCLIGANGCGKTSILQLAQILKKIPERIDDANEIVSGKLTDNKPKNIEWILILELSQQEQRMFYPYLNLPDEDQLRSIMRRVKLTFSMKVSNGQQFGVENQLLLTGMDISDTANRTFIPLLSLINPDKMIINITEFNEQLLGRGRINNNAFVDDHLRNSSKTEVNAKGYYTSKPTGSLPYELVQYFLSNLRYVPAFRETEKVVESKRTESESPVSESGSNVIQFMHTLYHNKRKRFDQISEICKRIFPEITNIHPYQMEDNQYTIAIEKQNSEDILLQHEASGLDQLLIILWKIESSPEGTIWFIDEPELHLHPGAQKALYEFFLDQENKNKQILVGTHSLIFIHKCIPQEISILFIQKGYTRIVSLEKLIQAEKATTSEQEVLVIKNHVFEALGYDPAFGFEAKNIVVVEGKTDKKIIRAFASTLGISLDALTTFIIPLGDKRSVERYVPEFAYTLTGKKLLIVLDNDLKNPIDLKNKIMIKEKEYKDRIGEKVMLNDENFYLFPENVYSIEYYLLQPEAICQAANQTDPEVCSRISTTIDEKLEQIQNKIITPKELLCSIWESLLVGSYDEVDTAEQIANSVTKQHLDKYPNIINLVNSMIKN